MRIINCLALLLLVLCVFIFPYTTDAQFSFQESISSQGSIRYSELTPPPTPTVIPNIENLAPINDGKWNTDDSAQSWQRCPVLNVFYDYQTTYQGNPTFRVEAADSTIPNCMGPDHDGIVLHPGDHIVMKAWIKTSGYAGGAATGARIGLDYYGANGRIVGASSQASAAAGTDWPNAPANIKAQAAGNYVPWGSDWTLKTWDFIVPNTCTADGLAYNPEYGYNGYPQGQQVTPTWCIPWFQIYGQAGFANTYTSWVSDFRFYINP